jgi:hypothetical protein
MTTSTDRYVCGITRFDDRLGQFPCVRDEHPDDDVHRDARGTEWRTAPLPARHRAADDQPDVDEMVTQAVKRRLDLPARLTTVTGHPVYVERINETTVRFGQYIFPLAEALDASIALARAATPPGGAR